jgi:hypothetical protein
MLGHIVPPHLFPHRLRIDQNPVQIEDDRCHHGPILPAPTWLGQADLGGEQVSPCPRSFHGGGRTRPTARRLRTRDTGDARLRWQFRALNDG